MRTISEEPRNFEVTITQRRRANAVNFICDAADRLRQRFESNGRVDHELFERVIKWVLNLRREMKRETYEVEENEAFEQIMRDASVSGDFVVLSNGPLVTIHGEFDIRKLRRDLVWRWGA